MDLDSSQLQVANNEAKGRFEVVVDGRVAELSYFVAGGRAYLVHAGVPPELEGRGIAARLAQYALDWARAEALTVVPRCPYVRSFLDRHHDWDDIVEWPD